MAAALAALTSILKSLFRGADPRQVPASQIEQAFEAAADNLYAIAQAGMITVPQAVAGMQAFLEQGIAYEAKANLGEASVKGAANMTKVIKDEIKVAHALPPIAPVALDLSKARTLYKSGGNWYAASLQTAAQLTDAYLEALPTGLGAGIGNAFSAVESALGLPSEISISGLGTIPTASLLILGLGLTFVGLWAHFRRSTA